MPEARYIQGLSKVEQKALQELYRRTSNADVCTRCQMILLSAQAYADQLILFALPTYSPRLNLIELLWKHLRRKVTHNHLFKTISQLVHAVCSFLDTFNQNPSLTLSIIGATE